MTAAAAISIIASRRRWWGSSTNVLKGAPNHAGVFPAALVDTLSIAIVEAATYAHVVAMA